MNIFLKKTIIFIVSLYTVLFFVLQGSNYLINKRSDFKLAPNINKIILGNSQPECAYNDSLITNFKNLANPGETYFYNYQKLKPLLKQNPQIDFVFIEFSNPNILIREDQKIWRNRFINHHLPNYISLLDLEDYYLLIQKNPAGFHKALLSSLKNNIYRIGTSSYNYIDSIGGYRYLKRQKVDGILDTLTQQNHRFKNPKNSQLSKYDLAYLDKIITLCQNNNITLCLIRSPYHPKFQVEQYEWGFQEMLSNRFKDITFLDFKDFPLENNEYGDLQHLNYKGARVFSSWFNENIIDSLKQTIKK